MMSLMLPVPLAVQVAPGLAEHVQLALLSALGSVSVTVAPNTLEGPLLVATMVYVMGVPGVAVLELSVLVIWTSAVGTSTLVSALLLGVGSVTPGGTATVALLMSRPVALGEMVALRTKVAAAPLGRFTEALMEPVPLAGQVPPRVAVQVQVALISALGILSVTVAPVTVDGPALVAVIV